MIPWQPLATFPQGSKDIEEGLKSVVLNGVDAKHILPKQLEILRQEEGDFSRQLFNGSEGRVGGFRVDRASVHLQKIKEMFFRFC